MITGVEEVANKKETLRKLIEKLHQGEDVETVRKEFGEVLKNATPLEISQVEDSLIKDGMPVEEIRKLCDVHLAVFKESLEKARPLAKEGHPIRILMEEHKIIQGIANEIANMPNVMMKRDSSSTAAQEVAKLEDCVERLKESESHYLREENVLFPYLEKKGITQPPTIMWMEHDKIREMKKNLYKLIDENEKTTSSEFIRQLKDCSVSLAEFLSSHFQKENSILFPTSLEVINENEWSEIRQQFDEIGYCSFTPESVIIGFGKEVSLFGPTAVEHGEGTIPFSTGALSIEEAESILDTLPVDVTFINKDDEVRYFNQPRDRIFVRTKAVIGRNVQMCHPKKSVGVVNKILDAFKDGSRDFAEFWITLDGKFVHIRFFAVRSRRKEYLGCVEVMQDVTAIRKLEGQRTLLDWK